MDRSIPFGLSAISAISAVHAKTAEKHRFWTGTSPDQRSAILRALWRRALARLPQLAMEHHLRLRLRLESRNSQLQFSPAHSRMRSA